jgi:Transcriptional regulator
MQLKSIYCFLAVSELLNFHSAADRLGVSQPALTAQIQALEEFLGVQLFVRNRQKTELTYAGNIFRKEATDLLQIVDGAISRSRATAHGLAGYLRIGFISTAVTAGVLSPLISEFRLMKPDIELNLQSMSTEIQLKALQDGKIDIAIVRLPLKNIEYLEITPLYFEQLILLLPKTHPLASRSYLDLSELSEVPFIINARHRATGYYDFIQKMLSNSGVVLNIQQEVEEMYTLCALVSSGLGVAVAPYSVRCYRLPGIEFKKLLELPRVGIALVTRKNETRECVHLFSSIAKERKNISPDGPTMDFNF